MSPPPNIKVASVTAYKLDTTLKTLPRTIIQPPMFVYGIRCAPADLSYLPESASADYYLDYGLLVFPHYTRPGSLAAGGYLGNVFWNSVKFLTEDPSRPHMVATAPDHPNLTSGERAVLAEIQRAFPMTETAWYHVPKVANTQRATQ